MMDEQKEHNFSKFGEAYFRVIIYENASNLSG